MTLFLRNPGKKLIVLFILMAMLAIPCFAQIDSLLSLSKKTNEPENKADLLNELAAIYFYRNLDSAMFYSQKAIIVSRNANYQKGEIEALINKVKIYRGSGEYEKAIAYSEQVKTYAEERADTDLLAKYYLLSGYNYFFSHKFNDALEQYEKSFSLFRENGSLIGMGDAQNKIGQVFIVWEEYETMLEYYLGALDCFEQADSKYGIATSLNNIGLYYFISDDYRQSESYIYKSIIINNKFGRIYSLSQNYMLLSNVKKMLGQIDSAFYYTEIALKLAKKLKNPQWEASTLLDLGILQQTNGNDSIALVLYHDAFQLSKSINSFINLSIISKYISEIHYKNGQLDSAYYYQREQYVYNDSLISNNSEVKFAKLKYQMQAETERQKMALQNQKTFYVYLMVFLCLFLVIIILFLLYTRQKIKTKSTLLAKENLANKMELKNKELASNILASQKKNELLGSIIKNIEDSMDIFPKKSKEIIKQVVENLKDAGEDKGWEDFEIVFSQVHESFFTKLNELYPVLSQKERRLCALLRLNMSSKEIAEATQMTPQSVDTARYRLRKKLSIDNPATDLVSFLMKV